MALDRSNRYPGRFENPTVEQPQGAFKNRTSPTAEDGSYFEADWANDMSGFFARVLNVAGVTPNGTVDNGVNSQLYDALMTATPGRLLNVRAFTTDTVVSKTPGAKKWRIRAVGGGGGSSAAVATGAGQTSMSNGGGAGAYAEGIYDVATINSLQVTIGAGGAGGTASSTYGGDGGTTSVGTLISCPGGKAGQPAGPANPPFQPVANNNSNSPTGWNILGVPGPGSTAGFAISTEVTIGSRGSDGVMGVGGAVPRIDNPAVTGGGWGSGASGCSNGPSQPLRNGAAGRPGLVIIEEYS
ncbi:hypothetical protein LLE75_03675 [Staphylococcus epidermidis]|nr:hypothetical protein [Staphylococcus epidermidis]